MEYYIASEQGPLGPYSLEELRLRPVRAEELVWRNGLSEWVRADSLDELAETLNPTTPPSFDRNRYDGFIHSAAPAQPAAQAWQPDNRRREVDYSECPPTYRWLAIIAFLGIIPCAIVAIIKSVMVTRLWKEGNHEGARRQSRSVLKWGLISCIIGIPLSIYYLFFFENPLDNFLYELF